MLFLKISPKEEPVTTFVVTGFWSECRDLFASAPKVQIDVRLGPALAGDAHPRRIKSFESRHIKN